MQPEGTGVVSFFGGPRPECDVQSVFRRLADEHTIRENGKF